MKKIIIATSGAPEAIGPYSQAVKAKGEMLYVSGQLPIDPVSKKLVEDNISLQTHQSLKNLKAILEELQVEEVLIAKETEKVSPELFTEIKEIIKDTKITFISHEELKKELKDCKAVVRTGEQTPYANIILKSGVVF